VHIQVALRNGLTRTEISEAILHCSVYCGIPRAADARRTMCAVFDKIDADKKRALRGPAKRRGGS
jgi:4-carboxymuconolactone decarboxylase